MEVLKKIPLVQGITHYTCLANKNLFYFSMGLNKIIYRSKKESSGQDNAADITVL